VFFQLRSAAQKVVVTGGGRAASFTSVDEHCDELRHDLYENPPIGPFQVLKSAFPKFESGLVRG